MFANGDAIILDIVINASICKLSVVYSLQLIFFCASIPFYPMFYWCMGLVNICLVSPLYLSMFWAFIFVVFDLRKSAYNLEKKTSIPKASLSSAELICTCPAKLKKQDWWFSLIYMNHCPFTICEFWLSYFACLYCVQYGFRRV